MKVIAKLCKAMSFVVILLVLIVYIPITIPNLLKYEVYSVVSGSMEPTINVGSIIYTKAVNPNSLDVGDIVVFQMNDANMPIAHRVVQNKVETQQLITKGDANEDEDLRPIEYNEVKGKVEFHIPFYGYFADAASTFEGKIAAVIFLLCGVLLGILSNQIYQSSEKSKDSKKSSAVSVVIFLFFGLLVSFCAFAGYRTIKSFDQRARAEKEREQYLSQVPSYSSVSFESGDKQEEDKTDDTPVSSFDLRPKTKAPDVKIDIPDIDIKKIKETAGDNFCGWIYIPDTQVNYPVYHTVDNDYYLHRSGSGDYSVSGAIFLDALNSAEYDDTHSILYGHHMADGSMFAGISKYKTDGYIDDHKYGVLITEKEVHLIEFFSGYVANVSQDAWDLNYDGEEGYAEWIDAQCDLSCFEPAVHPKTGDRVITLSTCSYEFDNARFVLHGILY